MQEQDRIIKINIAEMRRFEEEMRTALAEQEQAFSHLSDSLKIRNSILNRMIHDYQKMADHIGVESEIEFKVGKWYTPVEEYLK